MPSVKLYSEVTANTLSNNSQPNPLPNLLRTPSGLAFLEIQGTIHAPFPESRDDSSPDDEHQTAVGRLEFPLFDPNSHSDDQKWMKRVYLYVGKNQRLTGEVKKLPKPLVVVEKKRQPGGNSYHRSSGRVEAEIEEELEIIEVVKHKLLFGGRPEPVGD